MSPPIELNKRSLPNSAWSASSRQSPEIRPLAGEVRAGVAVVGAGFTGLSTAIHVHEKGGDAVVLDAGEPGWGASGRNGGQVIPGLKQDPTSLKATFGETRGEHLVRWAGGSADKVFDLIRRYGIECDARQQGWIQPAHAPAALETVRQRVEAWRQRGVEARELTSAETTQLVGCAEGIFHGGWLDPRGGAVHPLDYARGLARAARDLGARVFSHTRARALRRGAAGEWIIETESGTVRAERVVLATNGYTDELRPDLRRSLIPVYSFQIATRPLSENVRRTIFPQEHVASDTRRLLRYFRLDRDGRLLMGGRGPFSDSPTFADGAGHRAEIEKLFPQVGEPDLDYVWSGRVAITRDHLPHLHEVEPGVFAGVGFNGRGVAMGTLMGECLADLALGARSADMPLPVTPVRGVPFHALMRPAVSAMVAYYRHLDRREARTAS